MTDSVPFYNRRETLALMSAVAGTSLLAPIALASTKPEIVIIGGGFGGATAAGQLRSLIPNAQITLIEANPVYTACPFSNLVLSGDRQLDQQEFSYSGLSGRGIRVIHDYATGADPIRKRISLRNGEELTFDRLVLSPGIDFRWGTLEGYDEGAAELLPHAWKAGHQTSLLRGQLEDMRDGGLVVMSVPPAPFRCPPGPYERASLIAHYIKTYKPKSKLLILDSKDSFSKMPLFQEAWAEFYPDHLEWQGASDDGRVSRVDAATRTAFTDFGEFNADVVNIIPPQKAGVIAELAGVTDSTGWCPINGLSFESILHSDIYVIGDATIATPMPKSAFSANLQAKVCAIAIAEALAGKEVKATVLTNTCYSYTSPETAVSIAGVYRNDDGKLASIDGSGGLSPLQAAFDVRQSEAGQAAQWFETITHEAFG